MLYEDRIKDLSKGLRMHESPHELVRQSEAKHKQTPKGEAMCVDDDNKYNLEKTSLIDCAGNPIMHRTPNTN